MSEDANKDGHFLEQKSWAQEPLLPLWFKAAVWVLLLHWDFRFKPSRPQAGLQFDTPMSCQDAYPEPRAVMLESTGRRDTQEVAQGS